MTTPTESEFLWHGINPQNQRVNGVFIASNQSVAREELKRCGILVLNIRLKPAPWFHYQPRISDNDITVFSRQLANLIKVGIPLLEALDVIHKGLRHRGMIKLVSSLRNQIKNGDSLSQALAQHPANFDNFFCQLIATGEQAGVLELLLERLASYRENSAALKKKVRKALTYPMAVLMIALAITAVLLIWVIPTFEALFSSFGANLPLLTRSIIALSNSFQQNGWILMLVPLIGYGLNRYRKTSSTFDYRIQATLLRVPLLGSLIRKSVMARFALTLGTVLAAGLPLVDGLGSVANVCGNAVYQQALIRIRNQIASGQSLQFAINQNQLFPPLVVQMITIGESSGNLDSMLIKIADYYSEEVNYLIDHLTSLIEPLLMIILGLLIGGLILAMYLPIFSLGNVVT